MTRRLGIINTKIWRANDLAGAEMLRGRFADYSYDVHTHEKACLALITRGAIRIRTRGAEAVAQAGDLYAIDADEPHSGWPIDRDGWSLRTIYVEMARLWALLGGHDNPAGSAPALKGPIIRDAQLTALFRAVHSGSEEAAPALEREERHIAFIERLFQRYARGGPPVRTGGLEPRAIRLAQDFLDHRLDQRVRLNDIAEAAGLPPFQLFRAFEKTTGMTPHGYQRQARVRFAAGLIRSGHPLSEAALVAGFADQAHMTRSFRTTIGVTPGAYRNAFAQSG